MPLIVLPAQNGFYYSRSFVISYEFGDFLKYFCEKFHWNFDEDCIESVD